MTVDAPSLADIQRWMQTVITHPDGIIGGAASAQAREHLSTAVSDIEEIIGRSQALTSVERMQVYGNAYYARLIECLAGEFPATQAAVGEEAFSGFVFGYLQQSPPGSYTLSDLGSRFPHYLETSRPPRTLDAPDWADFLVDLAILERTYAEVFDGPGDEHEPALSADMLTSIRAEESGRVRLQTARSLRLLSVRFPVHEYATAVRHKHEAVFPEAAPTWLAIHRRDYIVQRRSLSVLQFALLERLMTGAGLDDALQHAIGIVDDVPGDLSAQLQQWFATWTAAGYFRGFEMVAES